LASMTAPLSPPAATMASTEPTPMQRAEEILFSRDSAAAGAEPPLPSRRILEQIGEPEPLVEEDGEGETPTRRRGRPPGSKNRPRDLDKQDAAPRGRPRLAPEVRKVALTPELVTAAIETIAKLEPGAQASAVPASRSFERGGFEEEQGASPAKRPRGRPRKAPTPPALAAKTETDVDEPADELWELASALRPERPGPGGEDSGGSLQQRRAKRSQLTRLFKPAERWKARVRLRSLARRQRARPA